LFCNKKTSCFLNVTIRQCYRNSINSKINI